jgi:hypothetical protein
MLNPVSRKYTAVTPVCSISFGHAIVSAQTEDDHGVNLQGVPGAVLRAVEMRTRGSTPADSRGPGEIGRSVVRLRGLRHAGIGMSQAHLALRRVRYDLPGVIRAAYPPPGAIGTFNRVAWSTACLEITTFFGNRSASGASA